MEGSVRDFVPSSSSSNNKPALTLVIFKHVAHRTGHSFTLSSDYLTEALAALPPTPSQSLVGPAFLYPVGESALVAQLVSKLHELEVTT
jgi:hypothetical protein